MAATAWQCFGAAGERMVKDINVDTASFRLVLLNDTYTIDLTDQLWSDLSTHEENETNYPANGASVDLTVTRVGQAVRINFPSVTFANTTLTSRFAAVIHDADGNGTLAASDVPFFICELEDGANVQTVTGDLVVNTSAVDEYTITFG